MNRNDGRSDERSAAVNAARWAAANGEAEALEAEATGESSGYISQEVAALETEVAALETEVAALEAAAEALETALAALEAALVVAGRSTNAA
jgi:hypothetical protein